jgi:CHASE3 domain sensor protein
MKKKTIKEKVEEKPQAPTKQDNIEMITNIINAMLDATAAETLATVQNKPEEALKQQALRDRGSNLLAQLLLASIEEPK